MLSTVSNVHIDSDPVGETGSCPMTVCSWLLTAINDPGCVRIRR